MTLSKSIIEKTGKNCLESFILSEETKTMEPYINDADKYPLWDGDIFLYTSDNHSNECFDYKVPIQLKSKKVDNLSEKNISFGLDICNLKKYKDDGGVLFIIVEYIDISNYHVFAKNLLPGDIIEILGECKESQQGKTIYFEKVETPHELKVLCLNFKLHKPLQSQIPEGLMYNSSDFPIFTTKGYINNINDIFKNDQYAYANSKLNTLIYVGKIKINDMFKNIYSDVKVRGIKYFNKFRAVRELDNEFIEICESVTINKENKLVIKFRFLDNTISERINELRFIRDIFLKRELTIGNQSTPIIFAAESEEKVSMMLSSVVEIIGNMEEILKKIEYFKIDPNNYKVSDLEKNSANINWMYDCIQKRIVGNQLDMTEKRIVYRVPLFDKMYLLYFEKNDSNDNYSCFDFLENEELNFEINIDGKNIGVSKYFSIPIDYLNNINLNYDKIVRDFRKLNFDDSIYHMSMFLVKCIICYDLYGNEELLNLSIKLNKFLSTYDEYSEEIYLINKYQTKYRKGKLEKHDRQQILLHKNNAETTLTKCGFILLLGYFEEFDEEFAKLSDEEQIMFKNWPIYKLYNEI